MSADNSVDSTVLSSVVNNCILLGGDDWTSGMPFIESVSGRSDVDKAGIGQTGQVWNSFSLSHGHLKGRTEKRVKAKKGKAKLEIVTLITLFIVYQI